MGLDVYAGSVTRYVAGDWQTIVQQAAAASGQTVVVVRPNEAMETEAVRDVGVVHDAVCEWRHGLLTTLNLPTREWNEQADAPYRTDKPDWDGYGAVLLLAAHLERPDLAPGAQVRRGLRRRAVEPVLPRAFPEAEAFKAASTAPARFPLLLRCAEWCLPLGPECPGFEASTPNGSVVRMGSVDRLVAELSDLNEHTLRLTPSQMSAARAAGPPRPGASVAEVAPFGLSVMINLAEFAAVNRLCWIMDY